MTLEETARYLKIGKSTLYKMAREGKIPAVLDNKIGYYELKQKQNFSRKRVYE